MWRSQRLRRVAGVGLAIIMLALAALSVIGVTETRRSAGVVSRATALAGAYDRAHDAIAAEELSEQHYRLEPAPSIRAAHAQAADALLAALADVDRLGTATDRRLARRLQTMHAGYLGAIVRLFDAVDAGDERTVTRIDNEAADPTFEQISALVQEATTAPIKATRQATVSKRLLVVDDNEDAANLLGEIARMRGHEVTVVHDPKAALAVVGTFRPEVAVLDIGLPGMDGYELAGRLQESVPDCRLIALTGYGQSKDRERALAAGFSAHLVKPVRVNDLLEMIAR